MFSPWHGGKNAKQNWERLKATANTRHKHCKHCPYCLHHWQEKVPRMPCFASIFLAISKCFKAKRQTRQLHMHSAGHFCNKPRSKSAAKCDDRQLHVRNVGIMTDTMCRSAETARWIKASAKKLTFGLPLTQAILALRFSSRAVSSRDPTTQLHLLGRADNAKWKITSHDLMSWLVISHVPQVICIDALYTFALQLQITWICRLSNIGPRENATQLRWPPITYCTRTANTKSAVFRLAQHCALHSTAVDTSWSEASL